jgi:hypothetical protein
MKVIYLHIATGALATIGAGCDSGPNSGFFLQTIRKSDITSEPGHPAAAQNQQGIQNPDWT